MEEKKEVYGVVYKATNLMNRKIYIGVTKNDFEWYKERHIRHALYYSNNNKNKNKVLYKAIRKYGPDMFKWEILGECPSKEELMISEKECIAFFQSNNRIYGYNRTIGGDGVIGFPITEEFREKERVATLKRYEDPMVRKKQGDIIRKRYEDNPELRNKVSMDTKRRNEDSEYRENYRNKIIALHSDPEFKKKQSEGLKKYYAEHPEELENLRTRCVGEKNKRYIPVDNQLILKLHNEGVFPKEIAKIMGVGHRVIYSRLKTLGIDLSFRTKGEGHPTYINIDMDTVLKLKEEGKLLKEIAAIMGVNKGLLQKRCRKYNIKFNKKGKNNPFHIEIDIKKAISLKEEGMSFEQIGKILGVSESLVSNRFRQLNIDYKVSTPNRKGKNHPGCKDIDTQYILQLKQKGKTTKEIAEMFGVSTVTINKRIREKENFL